MMSNMKKMSIIKVNTVASRGMAMGQAMIFDKPQLTASRKIISPDKVEGELARYRQAVDTAVAQVSSLSNQSDVFAAYADLIQDYALTELVENNIKNELQNCELAVENAIRTFSDMLAAMDDEYMRERAVDIRDIGYRLLSILQGRDVHAPVSCAGESDKPLIIIADDLSPSDTIKMDKSRIAGFVTQRGGITGHVAIIARSMGIPAFVGVSGIMDLVADDSSVILDSVNGEIILNPDEVMREEFLGRKLRWEEKQKLLLHYGKKPAFTIDGKPVKVLANAGCVEDVKCAAEYGADGIGLFRTEFLYMNSKHFPTEEEQFAVYKEAAVSFNKEITIRTLDIGGDKALPYFPFEPEENPFLGWRAIRISLSMQSVFKTQLRAILRAGFFGKLRIMYPMITGYEELVQANEILEECKAELAAEGKPFDRDIQVGIMIETPAAVILAHDFAHHVNFFSIGTNDLTQYILAVDRGNRNVAALYNTFHPAVLKSIHHIIKAGHSAGIEVGMCGEFAADFEATRLLVGMGLDEFSVAAASVPEIKQRIRNISVAEANASAAELRDCYTQKCVDKIIADS
jgi:phosphotransferase system enzyme I (PtsI)